MAINKISNDYATETYHFSRIPKAVWGAIAISFAALIAETDPFGDVDAVTITIMEEWESLYANGIVPQKPISLPR